MSSVRIVEKVMTSSAAPSQWELTLSNGRFAYVRYRHKQISIGIGDSIEDAVDRSAKLSPEPAFPSERECDWSDVEPYVLAAVRTDS